jgi:hypothetical protein
MPLTSPFGPISSPPISGPEQKTNLSTIATVVSLRKASVGEFLDVRLLHPEWFCGRGVELDRAGSIAAVPEMERERGEEKALAAEAGLPAKAANRETDGFRICHNTLKTHGHTNF